MSLITFKNSFWGSATLPISALYQRRTLDCVVDLANAISLDFLKHPNQYRNVPRKIVNILSEFRTSVGSHPDWPDATQRGNISGSIQRDLGNTSARLIRSAESLNRKESAENIGIVHNALVEEVIRLRNFLIELDGSVLSIEERKTRMIFQNAVEVLRCEEIARVFGMSPIPKGDWPFNGVFNMDAAYFIEEIAKRLLGPETTLCQQKFIILQRIAHYAVLTIQGVLDESRDWKAPEQMVTLFENASCWAQAIQNLLSNINIIRAWKDTDYRRTLEIAELDLLPDHPAGDIVLSCPEFSDFIPETQWMEYTPETDINCTYQCYTHGPCEPQTDSCPSWDPQCRVV